MICGSILRWPAAAAGWQECSRYWCPDPEGLRNEVGVLAHAVARALDLHDDGVVQQSVQQGGGDHRVRENLAPLGKAARLLLASGVVGLSSVPAGHLM